MMWPLPERRANMSKLLLEDLLALPQAELRLPQGMKQEDIHLTGVSIDTRTIRPNEVYWAIKGERFDGHNFVEKAMERGAALAVAEKKKIRNKRIDIPLLLVEDSLKALQQLAANHRRKFSFPVLALTGSNGKTTTKEMIAVILRQKYNVLKTEGNLNNHIGCPLTLLKLSKDNDAAVIEIATNHPGEIALLTELVQPTQAMVTNIGGAHLAYFASEEALAAEKLSLFDKMNGGLIYRNMDDPWIASYQTSGKNTVDYGWDDTAQVRGRLLDMDENGCGAFRLNDTADIRLSVPGWHNVKNALAAAAVALQFGFTEQEIAGSLSEYRGYDKRMQVKEHDGIMIVNDAYNANALSMQAAFDTVAAMQVQGKRIFALGDMLELGKNSVKIHYSVLLAAINSGADRLLLLGENMKAASERLSKDQRAIVENFSGHNMLAERLKELLKSGDLLLVKGSRGMAMEKALEKWQSKTKHNDKVTME